MTIKYSTDTQRRVVSSAVFLGIGLYLWHRQRASKRDANGAKARRPRSASDLDLIKREEKKVAIDRIFFAKFKELLAILIPSIRSKEMMLLVMHTLFLIARTWISLMVAQLDGMLTRDLVTGKARQFWKNIALWFAISIPATYTNSMIKYLQAKIGIAFRSRLTDYVHDLYLDNITFYKVVNLDSRIEGPDQLVTADVAKFCDALSALYSNMAKPMLDCLIFNYQLTKSVGTGGMIGIFISYLATAKILRILTPAFGKLAVKEAKLEGDFRNAHARLITNAEEIAFYNGGERELGILNKIYKHLVRHINSIYKIRIFYNMMEDFVIKYSWSAVGLLLTAVPVFFPEWSGRATRRAARLGGGNDAGGRTKDFVTNKRLLINLADAGGRMMYSYKELAELAGYTKRVHDMIRVFRDLQANRYSKTLVASAVTKTDRPLTGGSAEKPVLSLENIKGELVVLPSSEDQRGYVKLVDVPIATPSGEVLINKLAFDIQPGMHCLITGPNGCGKSTVVRIIAGLWPAYFGTVTRPFAGDILYIPQRPYLSIGTLRDQIIYPHTYEQMRKVGRTDAELLDILQTVHLAYIPDREGGWETIKEWKDVFSGGEKQRINMARLFYHKPKFAILDECTSAVSTDAEGSMYNAAKEMGMTLITVSHRPALLKYHQYLLHLSGSADQWEFSEIGSQKAVQGLKEEMKDLAAKVQEEDSLRKRLAEINQALGVNVNATKK